MLIEILLVHAGLYAGWFIGRTVPDEVRAVKKIIPYAVIGVLLVSAAFFQQVWYWLLVSAVVSFFLAPLGLGVALGVALALGIIPLLLVVLLCSYAIGVIDKPRWIWVVQPLSALVLSVLLTQSF